MYLAVPSQPDCATAWREAVRHVDSHHGHEAHNVVLNITNPTARSGRNDPIVSEVNRFVLKHGEKAVETVANTIFPERLYKIHGSPAFFDHFEKNVLPKVRKSERWSGYYFERMINLPNGSKKPINQLDDIVSRLKDPAVKARNKFEFTIFDPARDVSKSPYGGQCLSFGSFKKRHAGSSEYVDLTVMYRNHFYVEKLLGNIIGLGRLMNFIANESGLGLGELTIISTHATVDQPGRSTRPEILELLQRCNQLP